MKRLRSETLNDKIAYKIFHVPLPNSDISLDGSSNYLGSRYSLNVFPTDKKTALQSIKQTTKQQGEKQNTVRYCNKSKLKL